MLVKGRKHTGTILIVCAAMFKQTAWFLGIPLVVYLLVRPKHDKAEEESDTKNEESKKSIIQDLLDYIDIRGFAVSIVLVLSFGLAVMFPYILATPEFMRNLSLAAGGFLLLLGNLDQLEVEADVLTQDALRLSNGSAVILEPGTILEPIPGKVKRIECIRMKLGESDETGRRKPIPIKGSNFTLDVDIIIVAIGQEVDYSLLNPEGNDLAIKNGLFEVDNTTYQATVPWVFAGGDAVKGPGLVIEAIAQAQEAVVSIDRFMNNEDLYKGREKKEPVVAPKPDKDFEKIECVDIPKRSVKERIDDFEEVELPLTEEQAIKEANRCLSCNFCSICMQCIDACEADAINHDMIEKDIALEVGSVILAPGYELFDAKIKREYGYGRFPNVVNSLEFERILSASGPYQGHVIRPSDEKEPKKIAWIQCVGSRDNACGNNYCSSVCCTYAIKEAVIAKEHAPNIKPTIFYMDMRTYGKGFERYYNRAENEYGVEFIRCRVSAVE